VDERAFELIEPRFFDRAPAPPEGNLDYLGTKPHNCRTLGLRSILGNNDGPRNLPAAGRPGDALGHVAGACRHHTITQRLAAELG
jgi:hypothetical protein